METSRPWIDLGQVVPPLEGWPRRLQAISRLLPPRHLNDGMLDVMVRGRGAGVVTSVAVRLFRWDAD